jgi:hypothetical protein
VSKQAVGRPPPPHRCGRNTHNNRSHSGEELNGIIKGAAAAEKRAEASANKARTKRAKKNIRKEKKMASRYTLYTYIEKIWHFSNIKLRGNKRSRRAEWGGVGGVRSYW